MDRKIYGNILQYENSKLKYAFFESKVKKYFSYCQPGIYEIAKDVAKIGDSKSIDRVLVQMRNQILITMCEYIDEKEIYHYINSENISESDRNYILSTLKEKNIDKYNKLMNYNNS